ncbi:MAG: glycoside hydrolase family 9 protein, partial [Cyanobacteria bacterium]|nr:glycoside hydrolase family 9 protein [Cyanobacteriota bacterium]
PGLLVGGPNATPTDGKTPANLDASSYQDLADAISSNEPHILNNASLALMLGLLNDSYNQ